MEIIRRDVAADKVRVDNPTQNLESYFLGVVEKAKQSAAETSGATSGARVAEYLRGDGTDSETAKNKMLDRLTQSAPKEKIKIIQPEPIEKVDQRKLDSLTKPTEEKSVETVSPVSTKAPEKPADLSKANEKLSSLLGKPKE